MHTYSLVSTSGGKRIMSSMTNRLSWDDNQACEPYGSTCLGVIPISKRTPTKGSLYRGTLT